MKQKNNFSLRGQKGAKTRWKKEEGKLNVHLNSISKCKEYKNLKARLMGFLAGDGTVGIRKENKRNAIHHDIAFYPDHSSMIGPFIEAFTYLYIKKPLVRKKSKYYSIKVSSKFACLDLVKTINFGLYKWEVPFNFLDTDESKIEWLRSFFDCEAYISNQDIRVQSVNERGLLQVKKLLGELGIDANMYKYERKNKKWSTNYILSIMKKDYRKMYLNKIGFNHILKLNKLKLQFKASVPESG